MDQRGRGRPEGGIEGAAVLIAGPTASGKSALARRLARERVGVVVNADSMQVYAELRILTARPSAAEEAEVPHRLFGHVSAARRYSVGAWLKDAAEVLAETRAAGRTPIFVGGTGLYFKALTEGLAEVPAIPDEIRRTVAAEAEGLAPEELHDRLARLDPAGASKIRASDPARITRAFEVIRATGKPLHEWQKAPGRPLVHLGESELFLLDPPRSDLYRVIDDRVDRMMEEGALAEVERLRDLGLDPRLPAMRALGVRPLLGHLAGEIGLADAVEQMKAETRRYAKRQVTWFRHQTPAWPIVDATL